MSSPPGVATMLRGAGIDLGCPFVVPITWLAARGTAVSPNTCQIAPLFMTNSGPSWLAAISPGVINGVVRESGSGGERTFSPALHLFQTPLAVLFPAGILTHTNGSFPPH